MRATASTSRIILSFLLAFLTDSTPALLAQTTIATGSVVGSVNDPTGAFINNASVKITNLAKSFRRERRRGLTTSRRDRQI
jgi:hypothetical protein